VDSKPEVKTLAKRTASIDQDDVLKTYFAQIKDIPLLSFAEELELARLIQEGDEGARHRLIEANLRLVVKIARSYVVSDMPLMDIIQEGNLGLMHAAEKFCHKKNVRFSTYAGWWIRQSISRFLANKRRTIRIPHRKEELLRKIHQVSHGLTQALMRQPRNEEIAEEIGVSKEDVEYIINLSSGYFHLESESENNNVVTDIYGDYTYSPEHTLMRKYSRDATLKALKTLKTRERCILMYRYQFNGNERHTLKSIGDKMGLSPETVRQIEMKAIEKMRDLSDELHPYHLEAI
jgi:RNA polymerase primary sigma factor